MSDEQPRQRIQWLTETLSVCRDHAQREALIPRLLDTQNQLMFLKLGQSNNEKATPGRSHQKTLHKTKLMAMPNSLFIEPVLPTPSL